MRTFGKCILPLLIAAIFFRVIGIAFATPACVSVLGPTQAHISQTSDNQISLDTEFGVDWKVTKHRRRSLGDHSIKNFVAIPSTNLSDLGNFFTLAPIFTEPLKLFSSLDSTSRPPCC